MSLDSSTTPLARPRLGWLRDARRRIRDDAVEQWRVPPRTAEAIFLVPLVGAVLVAATRLDSDLFRFVTGEDRVLEWLQLAAYLTAMLFAAACAFRLVRTGGRLLGSAYALFALGCLLVAGEEIAWGQRAFGLETPEGLAEVNSQAEITVHNIGTVQVVFNVVVLLGGLYGSVGAWAIRRRVRPTETVNLLVPPLFLASAFFVMFAFRLIRFIDYPRSNFTIVEYGEWPELGFALALAIFAGLNLRRLGRHGRFIGLAAAGVAAVVLAGVVLTEAQGEVRGAEPTGAPLTRPYRTVVPTVETDPVPSARDAADDPAIWIHPTDRSLSTIIGTDKRGGLAVYDLRGRELQFIPGDSPNNVDLRSGFELAGRQVTLVAAGYRDSDTIAVYRVDVPSRRLVDVAARPLELGIDIHGACLYRSQVSGGLYFFGNSNSGEVEQWELVEAPRGRVSANRVRRLELGTETEGCATDDELGRLYISQETRALWRYGAEPDAGRSRVRVDSAAPSGRLAADIEGVAIAKAADGTGYLLVSSQGNNSFVAYRREGRNSYVHTFRIQGVEHTDGIDVTTESLGPAFPNGMLVAQDGDNDGENQNFKLVPWERFRLPLAE